jgi:hypothetical protein
MSENWHLIGDGEPLSDCASRRSYHIFHDGTRVHHPKQCTRRECPICCDRRYLKDSSDDIARTILGWIMWRVAKGELYDQQGRSLKVFKYVYSRCENDGNLRLARKSARKILKAQGLRTGYSIIHPYRGEHEQDDDPATCREKMDRSRLSIHIHGFAVGYWTSPLPKGSKEYFHCESIADARSFRHTDMPIILRSKLLVDLQYALGHAGYYGEKGQCVSTWGERPQKDQKDYYKPDQPELWLKHPTITCDGEPVWERWQKPDNEIEAELQWSIKAGHIPVSGEITGGDGLMPWYALEQIERKEFHRNWFPWRETIALVISNKLGVSPDDGDWPSLLNK